MDQGKAMAILSYTLSMYPIAPVNNHLLAPCLSKELMRALQQYPREGIMEKVEEEGEIYEEEWSFGYCESGSGLFSCPPKENPMYTYRESLFLGCTSLSDIKVNQLLTELNREWPGYSYDLLSKNCNHFCDQFCEKLGVQKLPAWVNRFANIGETAVEVAQDIVSQLQQAKSDIIAASKFAYEFLFGGAPMSSVSSDPVSIHAVTVPSGSCSSFQISQFKIPVCASSQITANSQDMCRGKSLQETITRDDAELGRDFSAERGFPLADTL